MKNKPNTLYVIYFWLILLGIIPLTLVLFTSFLSHDQEHLASLPFSLAGYKALLSVTFFKILLRSILLGLFTTLLCLLIAYPFSYYLIKSKHQSLLLTLIIIPFWTSSLVRTYSLIAILKNKGVINTFLINLHLIDKPIPLLYTNFAVLCGLVYNLFPFMVLPLFTNMERFDFKLIEAAKDLGAGSWTIFRRVFLPHTLNGIFSGSVLVFLPAMTLFYIPNVLGGARSILLGNLIQNQFLVLENWPQGAATSVVLTLTFLMLFLIYRKPQESES